MVSSFMVAVAGCPAVFRADNPMRLEPEQTIELTGIAYRSMSLQPYQIHRHAQDGCSRITRTKPSKMSRTSRRCLNSLGTSATQVLMGIGSTSLRSSLNALLHGESWLLWGDTKTDPLDDTK